MVSKLGTTEYPALLFPSKTKLLPSVYQISSGLVRGFSDNPLGILSNAPEFLGNRERGESPRGSAGEYQADERAEVARLRWRVSGR